VTESPDGLELSQDLARRLAALDDGPIRTRAAARHLAALPGSAAARAVAALLADPAPRARAVTSAVAAALADPAPDLPYDQRAAIYEAATESGLAEVAALLVAGPPLRAWDPPRERDARLAALTLGHKKALARADRDPDLLARLAAEGEPPVVRELLANPMLTEAFAVRIAARRPCRPETLRLLAGAPRWRTRRAIARAIARNPYAQTEVAIRLLAVLPGGDLAELAADGAVHPLVRATASRLVRSRRSAARGG
jgi:hypothetical protein